MKTGAIDLYRMLESGHVQPQGTVDACPSPLVVLDQHFCFLGANREFVETFLTPKDNPVGQSFFALGDGEWETPELRTMLRDVISKSSAPATGCRVSFELPPIGPRIFLISARRLPFPNGDSCNIVLIFHDVTDLDHAEAEKDILLAEAHHRTKNLLAVVRGLASQTQAEGRTGKEYRDAFLGRFEVFLRVQDLSVSNKSGTLLGILIDQILQLGGPGQICLEPGPQVWLGSAQVLPLSMILHELSTNALKYGALSTPEGVVHVAWVVAAEEGQRKLHLEWREENGPPVTPPSRCGFGTRLIELSARGELEGDAELRFEVDGLQARISVSLK